MKEKNIFPLIPLRDMVLFPKVILTLSIGRTKSIAALKEGLENGGSIFLVAQKDVGVEDPEPNQMYKVGTVATVFQSLNFPDGSTKILVTGERKARIVNFLNESDFFKVEIEFLESDNSLDIIKENIVHKKLITNFVKYVSLSKKNSIDLKNIEQIDDLANLSDLIVSHLNSKIKDKQLVLECLDLKKKTKKVLELLLDEIASLEVEVKLNSDVEKSLKKHQKEYFLSEKLKAIQKELGDGDGKDELSELASKISKLKIPKEIKNKAEADLKKLKFMSPISHEATVLRNYLDCFISLPWGKFSVLHNDIKMVSKIMEEFHHALDKVKERILEYIAVQNRVGKVRGTILCFVGPPGVGKTSLAKSIANATGRVFSKVALGGVKDESEIRGHRRTYIGSMPGKIIQAMKKSGTNNPLILLDEIDKISMDWRGDPAAALLEVLDPEQNYAFNDNYLEVDYDLSNVMFIATANTLQMSPPLLDRMEVIRIAGYTDYEKIEIARKHLIPKQMKEHGLKEEELIYDQETLKIMINEYTKEAGVRNLERNIAKLCRKAVVQIDSVKSDRLEINENNLVHLLGTPVYRRERINELNLVGITKGLAWTEAGGEVLLIEALKFNGKGRLKITGKLGEIMQESAQAALSFVRSRSLQWGIASEVFENTDFHIHVPEGAIPKDGPSAGITISTALISVLTGIPVRHDVAMTGEITLRGRVLAIGGLREKLLAAHRNKIRKVFIPQANASDLLEIKEDFLKEIEINFVSDLEEVISGALENMPVPLTNFPISGVSSDKLTVS